MRFCRLSLLLPLLRRFASSSFVFFPRLLLLHFFFCYTLPFFFFSLLALRFSLSLSLSPLILPPQPLIFTLIALSAAARLSSPRLSLLFYFAFFTPRRFLDADVLSHTPPLFISFFTSMMQRLVAAFFDAAMLSIFRLLSLAIFLSPRQLLPFFSFRRHYACFHTPLRR